MIFLYLFIGIIILGTLHVVFYYTVKSDNFAVLLMLIKPMLAMIEV